MGHCIERLEDGSYSIAWAGEPCWHGLGFKVPGNLSPAKMLKAAKLDWKVNKVRLHLPSGKPTDMTALVRDRDDKILDYVPDDWHELQNSDAFAFFNEFVQSGDMEMHTAGSLLGGKIVWGLAKIKNSFSVFGKDLVDNYLLFSNPHKHGKSIDIRTTSIRVVCNNTITMALNGGSNNQIARFTHGKAFDPELAKSIIKQSNVKHQKLKEAYEFLAKKRVRRPDEMKTFMQQVFPVANQDKKPDELSANAAKALGIINMQPGHEIFPDTWYNALQACTFMMTHDIGREKDATLWNQWYGANQTKGIEAMNRAIEFARAA